MLSAIPREGVSQEAAIADIERIMRSRHGLRLDEQNDFDIVTQDALMRVWNQISQATFFALVVISSIALMVGGIGVMAIMSISVTERTREIGVRRALGARRREVLFQFLTEAAVLTSVGGIARNSSRKRPRAWPCISSPDSPSRFRSGLSLWASASPPLSVSSSACIPPSAPPAWIRSKHCGTSSRSRNSVELKKAGPPCGRMSVRHGGGIGVMVSR